MRESDGNRLIALEVKLIELVIKHLRKSVFYERKFEKEKKVDDMIMGKVL